MSMMVRMVNFQFDIAEFGATFTARHRLRYRPKFVKTLLGLFPLIPPPSGATSSLLDLRKAFKTNASKEIDATSHLEFLLQEACPQGSQDQGHLCQAMSAEPTNILQEFTDINTAPGSLIYTRLHYVYLLVHFVNLW